DAGASIEDLENKLDKYTQGQLLVFSELAKNTQDSGEGYTFSCINDSFSRKWLEDKKPIEDFKTGAELFVSQFIRNFEANLWGFIVYQELEVKPGIYSASLRSQSGIKDVAAIAAKLGGGGHKSA